MERVLCPEMLIATVSGTPARTISDSRAAEIMEDAANVFQVLASPWLHAASALLVSVNFAFALRANQAP